VELQKAKFAFIPIGDGEIELIEPTDSESSIAKFIEEKGEGIHHISLKVEGIEKILEKLREKGIKLIDDKPRIGAHEVKIAFIDPTSAKGILIELCDSDQ
jgi:methylmalonyl-CoA epimerase